MLYFVIFMLGLAGTWYGRRLWKQGRKALGSTLTGASIMAALLWLIVTAAVNSPEAEQRRLADAAPQRAAEGAAGASIASHRVKATVDCRRGIESAAKYSVEWMDSGFSAARSFGRISEDAAAGTLTLTGDRARFQNGFGAMLRARYACKWSEAAGVVAVEISPL